MTDTVASIAELQAAVWANKVAKGFNTTDVPLEFCLLQGEVAETFDAWRKDPAGLPSELADVAIFLLSLAEMVGVDLETGIRDKMAVNAGRTYVTDPVTGTLLKETS